MAALQVIIKIIAKVFFPVKSLQLFNQMICLTVNKLSKFLSSLASNLRKMIYHTSYFIFLRLTIL